MKQFQTISKKDAFGRLVFSILIILTIMIGTNFLFPFSSSANHPVLVEGDTDFDGDGLLGIAENTDNSTDRIFGTITAALDMPNGGANQNGRVTIVTSGRFPELVVITGANGNVSLEGAPGVDANIDAVLAGATGNPERQAQPGIVVNAPSTRVITIRNIMSRNWTDGIQVTGSSRVIIDNCRLEQNVNFGIRVMGTARVAISNCQVNGSGFRVAPGVDGTPSPGIGIRFEGQSSGTVAFSTVNGSVAAGISNTTGNSRAVGILNVNVFDNNNRNFENINPPKGSTPGTR
ncbi:MAG: right-handed parallel beta-helix repeat-containing protein [Acidobacteriota bacterium]